MTQDQAENEMVAPHPGIMANNRVLAERLRSGLSSGDHAFRMVPNTIESIIEEEAWMARLDRDGNECRLGRDEFEAFITSEPPRGIGVTLDEVRKYLGDPNHPRRLMFESLIKKGSADPGGIQGSKEVPPGGAPHPMQAVVLQAFRQDEGRDYPKLHDRDSLACYLGGCVPASKDRVAYIESTFRRAAEDVLGYMHGQGLLVRDEQGRYYLAPGVRALDGPTSLPNDRN